MTWNLAQTMSLIKAAQHKYTHRKLVGRDPKTNRPRYRYYYARHHGGGITSAKFEAGSAFRLTFKGRTGHFHVESVDGDMVTVRHDGRKGSKPIEMSRDELRALLERQHSKLETKSREKAQKRRKSAAKKRKSTKRKSTKRQAPAKRPQLSVADQVEEHRGQLLDQAKALKERIEGLDKKKDKEEIARLRDEAGALSGAALLAQRAQRDGIESAGPMIQKQIEQTQRMIDRSDNAEHTARLTRDLEQKRKLLDIIEGKTQVEPERPKREKTQQGADNFAEAQSKKAREAINATPRTEAAANRLIEEAPLEVIPYILLEAVRADRRGEEGFKDLIRVAANKVTGLGVSPSDVMRAAQEPTGAPIFAVYDQAHYEGDMTQEKHAGLLRRAEHMAELIKEGGRAEMAHATELRNIYQRILPSADTQDINAIATRRTPEAKRRELLESIAQQIAESAPESLEIQSARRELRDAEQAIEQGINMSSKDVKDAVAERDKKAAKLAELTETTQQAPQRSQTAQAFSSMVDTIKSGERSQKAQAAFKTELDKVIDKAESGTLTDAERAELLPIAEQLVEVTSGRARALMTAVRDQIKGSSERGEVEEETQSTRPQIKSREEAAEYLKESLLEELGEGHSVKVWRKERSGKSPIVRVYVQQKLRRGWSDMGYYSISDKGKVYPNFDRRPAGMRDLAAYIMQRADLDI